jgi:hypothetical protein
VAIDLGPEGVSECLQQAGVGFMFAPRYHPAMQVVRPVRSALKVGLLACCWRHAPAGMLLLACSCWQAAAVDVHAAHAHG